MHAGDCLLSLGQIRPVLWLWEAADGHFFTCTSASALMFAASVTEWPSEVPEQEGDRIRTLQAVPGTRVECRQLWQHGHVGGRFRPLFL